MKGGLSATVATLALGLLTACSSGALEDDFSRTPTQPVEAERTDPPSQREIDEIIDGQFDGPRCVDVTSIDNNWGNDVLCTRADGSRFYTSYEGADEFLGR